MFWLVNEYVKMNKKLRKMSVHIPYTEGCFVVKYRNNEKHFMYTGIEGICYCLAEGI
jgi:hypothetical protein